MWITDVCLLDLELAEESAASKYGVDDLLECMCYFTRFSYILVSTLSGFRAKQLDAYR